VRRTIGRIVCLVTALLAVAAPLHGQDAQKRRGLSVKITNPVAGDVAIGKTHITAEVKADRPDLIEAVEFSVGDELVFRDTEPPWECTYDFGPESAARVIRAVVRHKEGITVSDVVVTRKIDLSFAVRVNRVELNMAVTDKDGHFVTGVDRKELTVLEEGRTVEVVDFSLESRPLSVALVIDTSGSMQERIETAQKAAGAFVQSLREGDRAMVVDFSDKVYLLSDLTEDRAIVKAAIESTKASGGTAIYDAVYTTLRKLRPVTGRKAIVLLSDGGDTTSFFERDKVVEAAKAADVTIYTIGLGTGSLDPSARSLLKSLSEATGGSATFAKDETEVASAYVAITDDLRHQYYLTYESPNETFDGRWIKIEVKVARPNTEVRARSGYFAGRTSS